MALRLATLERIFQGVTAGDSLNVSGLADSPVYTKVLP
jgi:hypothetical protein